MKSAERLSRSMALAICLLLFNVSIFSSLFPSGSFTFASESPQDTIQNTVYKNDQNEKDDSLSSPFETLWKAFKDVLDSTTNVLSASLSSAGLLPDEENDFILRSEREIESSMLHRRGFLMEQSINEHYMQQFFNYFPRLKEYTSIAEEENLIFDKTGAENSQNRASPRTSVAVRWTEYDPIKGSTLCYCFSESRTSYWSFEWCPDKETIYQGTRKVGKILPEYNLGKRLILSDGSKWVNKRTLSDATSLVTAATAKYPSAIAVHPYVNGDTCAEAGSQRRTSVVVLHKNSSAQCGHREDEGIIIEKVIESKVCQYTLHICLDTGHEDVYREETIDQLGNNENHEELSSPNRKYVSDVITESGLKEINQTLHYIKNHVTGSFARKSRADARGNSRENMFASLHSAFPPFPQTRIEANMKLIKEMFMHAYDSYMYHGYPASEVKPITCGPASFHLVKIPGLTLIDSLDTLVILGNYTEFARAVERLKFLNDNIYEETGIYTSGDGLFDINYNVSVFETNIRVLGGLLSGHQLATAFLEDKVLQNEVWGQNNEILLGLDRELESDDCKEGEEDRTTAMECDRHWVYDGFLLELARDLGDRLLLAFNTKTGIPYGTVNLISGIPERETPIASLAGGGTLSLEMELLSRLTGNNEYGRAAKLATRALWMRRSTQGLFGKHICTRSGSWTETLSGIGSNSDSFYEYLIKHHILFPEDSDFWFQLVAAYGGVHNETKVGDWYGDVDMRRGKKQKGAPRRVFESLMAFYPGMQVLLGELAPAARTLNSFFLVREYLGFLPERFDFEAEKVDHGGGDHLLRPELLESAYFLHRSSKGLQNQFRSRRNNHTSDSSGWVWSGDFALHTLEKLTRTECGYGSVKNVTPKTSGKLNAERHQIRLMNEMPSYFLSETLKYLYLLFDDSNILHMDEERDWVFTTEAHPIHNEPKTKSSEAKLMDQAKELKSRMKRRLSRRKKGRIDATNGLWREKWTNESKSNVFSLGLEPLMKNDRETYQNRRQLETYNLQGDPSFSSAVERIFSKDMSWSPFDVFSERLSTLNPTYLTFRKLGNELELTHSCPNLYASNYLWIRALNGGITDYTDSFQSRKGDEFLVTESDIIQLGCVDALALHGAGVHIQSLYNAFFRKRNQVQSRKEHDDNSLPKKTERPTEGEDRGSHTRFDMGYDLGSFDVSAFPGGSGFLVQHVESGESVVTTLIDEEPLTNGQGPLILVYSSNDPGSDESGTYRDYSDGKSSSRHVVPSPRAVVLADTHGNSYACEVQILETTTGNEIDETCDARESSKYECVEPEIEDTVLHRFPCSPALFGPTRTSHLQKVKTIEVEAEIRPSSANDKYGCGRFSMEQSSKGRRIESETPVNGAKEPVISLVERGDCTFQEKSLNKHLTEGAKGVIVVNNHKGDDLFVMSGGGSDELEKLRLEDYPVTVLVTWDDGQKMQKAIKALGRKNDDSQIFARISLLQDQVPQDVELRSPGESKFWPRVKASPESLQIYSRSGWGVHAVQVSGAYYSTELQWQLYLLKHDMAKGTVP
eukprot:CAMPEP_0116146756 /NCGR_PEP_ID=MMETSP0329-20121206/17339_1 /TAXON_ID=697910 /ORGANISM="Pseudo-nitzschia arenysensis, Strain B593" /LENGTH=1537 /DNA_ID=CAMNT_0003642535 /DNA_START=311 /DNA_END=4924 /DNA_ORIENTATION=-